MPSVMPSYADLRDKSKEYGEQDRFAELRKLYGPSSACAPFLDRKHNILRLSCELDDPRPDSNEGSASNDDQSPSATDTSPHTTIVDFPITDRPLHVQPGALGRGTVVLPLASPPDIESLQAPDGLVAKMSWQPKGRMREDATLRVIRKKIEAWTDHVTDLRCSTTLDSDALKLPRKKLMTLIEARVELVAALREGAAKEPDDEAFLEMVDAFIGDMYEERVLVVLVSPRYQPLKAVRNMDEFRTVFKDVVQGKLRFLSGVPSTSDETVLGAVHYVIYLKCGILRSER